MIIIIRTIRQILLLGIVHYGQVRMIRTVTASSSSASKNYNYNYHQQQYHHPTLVLQKPPITFGSILKKQQQLHRQPTNVGSLLLQYIKERWEYAKQRTALEQYVEDYNAEYVGACSGDEAMSVRHRRLIVLPLDERFDPPVGVFSHGHLQTGDKVCLPSNFWSAIQYNSAEVPWLFSIKRLDTVPSNTNPKEDDEEDHVESNNNLANSITSPRVQLKTSLKPPKKSKIEEEDDDDDEEEEDDDEPIVISEYTSFQVLDEVIAGPLDFRAPSNYIFVPYWMMRALRIRPYDIVQVDLVKNYDPRIPAGSLTKLRPHSSNFSTTIANPQAVLETELRHYSSLTVGSTIAFDYNKQRYWFDVVECRSAPRGEKQKLAIKVQDCDIATDFLPAKDVLKNRKKKKKEAKYEK